MENVRHNIPRGEGKRSYLQYIQSHGGDGRASYAITDENGHVTGINPGYGYAITITPKNDFDSHVGRGAGLLATGAVVVGIGIITGPVGWVALALTVAALTTTLAGSQDLLDAYYAEKTPLSTITLTNLKNAQRNCYSGELAGN